MRWKPLYVIASRYADTTSTQTFVTATTHGRPSLSIPSMTDPTFYKLSEWHLEGTMMIDPSVFQNLPRPSEWVLNAGRKSKRKTESGKRESMSRAPVSTAESSATYQEITQRNGGISPRGMIPRIGGRAVGNARLTSKASPVKNSPPSTLSHPSGQHGFRGNARSFEQCYKCGVYCVHRSGLCKDCR